MRLWAIVEGLSLEMLCVLDRIGRGEMPEAGRDMLVSVLGFAIASLYMQVDLCKVPRLQGVRRGRLVEGGNCRWASARRARAPGAGADVGSRDMRQARRVNAE